MHPAVRARPINKTTVNDLAVAVGWAELREEYRAADALLLPSRLEGFGYVVAEAMACKLPVITTNGTSLPELVEDGFSGKLCTPNDPEAFAAAVRRLDEDPALRRSMGERAGRAGRAKLGPGLLECDRLDAVVGE